MVTYHRARGHHTEDCIQLKREIETLIQRGHLLTYVKDDRPHNGKRSPRQEDPSNEKTSRTKNSESREGHETKTTRHTLNTIAGGFAGGGETSSARKRYARTVMHVDQKMTDEPEDNPGTVTFSKKDAAGVLAHDNDPMVIKVQIRDWSIKRVLIDPGSSADVLYWDAFRGMELDTTELLPFKGTLVGFSGEQVQVLGHLALPTTFRNSNNTKTV